MFQRFNIKFLKDYVLLIILMLFCVFGATLITIDKLYGDSKIFNIIKERLETANSFSNLINRLDVLSADFRKSSLPHYELAIKDEKYKQFRNNPREKISGKLSFNGKKYDVKIQCNGGQALHCINKKKSLSIDFTDELFQKMEKINLILPEDRHYILEHFNNYRAKKMGLIAPDSKFVTLSINGESYGVYYQTGLVDQEFLAKNKKIDNADLFKGELPPSFPYGYLFGHIGLWTKTENYSFALKEDFSSLEKLLKTLHYSAEQKTLYRDIFNIIDKENMALWAAHSLLVKSPHQDNIHNMRLYFNPAKGNFEFIPWDVLGLHPVWDTVPLQAFPLVWNHLREVAAGDYSYLIKRNSIIWNYVRNKNNLKDDLKFMERTWKEIKYDFYKDKIKVLDKSLLDWEITTMPTLNDEIKKLKKAYANHFENYYQEFKYNKVAIYIQCPPATETINVSHTDKKILCRILIKPDVALANPTVIDEFSFSVSGGESLSDKVWLYYDNNVNYVMDDNEDLLLAEKNVGANSERVNISLFRGEDGISYRSPFRLIKEKIYVYTTPFSPEGFNYDFFIVAGKNLSISDVQIKMHNSVTNEPTEQYSLY